MILENLMQETRSCFGRLNNQNNDENFILKFARRSKMIIAQIFWAIYFRLTTPVKVAVSVHTPFRCQTLSAVRLKFKTEHSHFVSNTVNCSLKHSRLSGYSMYHRLLYVPPGIISKNSTLCTESAFISSRRSQGKQQVLPHRINWHIVYIRGAGQLPGTN